MPNTAYLIATDNPGPTIDRAGEPRYRPKEIQARGPVTLPVLWLALFNREHLIDVDIATDDRTERVPSLVAEAAEAKDILASRAELILSTFPEFGPTHESFSRLLSRSKRHHLKVHLEEIWMLDPTSFGPGLDACLRWFSTRDTADFAELLAMASICGYDPARRTFPRLIEETPRAFHLRGFAWREVDWDNEADI